MKSVETASNRLDLIELFEMFKGLSHVGIEEMFTMDENKQGTRDHNQTFFSNRVVNRWNLLDKQTVDAPSLNAFQNRLSLIRSNRMGFFMD